MKCVDCKFLLMREIEVVHNKGYSNEYTELCVEARCMHDSPKGKQFKLVHNPSFPIRPNYGGEDSPTDPLGRFRYQMQNLQTVVPKWCYLRSPKVEDPHAEIRYAAMKVVRSAIHALRMESKHRDAEASKAVTTNLKTIQNDLKLKLKTMDCHMIDAIDEYVRERTKGMVETIKREVLEELRGEK